jgi:hypothetical protein
MNTTEGTAAVRSSVPRILPEFKASAESALTLTGMSCARSARFSAVTTISTSDPSGGVALCAHVTCVAPVATNAAATASSPFASARFFALFRDRHFVKILLEFATRPPTCRPSFYCQSVFSGILSRGASDRQCDMTKSSYDPSIHILDFRLSIRRARDLPSAANAGCLAPDRGGHRERRVSLAWDGSFVFSRNIAVAGRLVGADCPKIKSG